MPEEAQDAVVESSPTDAAVSSTEEQVVAQVKPTPEPTKEFHMPPAERWEELRQRQVAAEQRADKAEQLAQLALQKLGVVAPQPVADYWAGKTDHPDPVTARFWQDQKAMVDPLFHEVKALREAVDVGRNELAGVKVENFRLRNPNIAPNSEDEKAIASYVAQNYPMEAAKKLALYDRLEQENQALKAKQSLVGSKVSANATGPTTSIPAGAGLPGKPGDWRENVRQASRKGGSLADILNAAGATKTP